MASIMYYSYSSQLTAGYQYQLSAISQKQESREIPRSRSTQHFSIGMDLLHIHANKSDERSILHWCLNKSDALFHLKNTAPFSSSANEIWHMDCFTQNKIR
jgi:hypothetical protein